MRIENIYERISHKRFGIIMFSDVTRPPLILKRFSDTKKQLQLYDLEKKKKGERLQEEVCYYSMRCFTNCKLTFNKCFFIIIYSNKLLEMVMNETIRIIVSI